MKDFTRGEKWLLCNMVTKKKEGSVLLALIENTVNGHPANTSNCIVSNIFTVLHIVENNMLYLFISDYLNIVFTLVNKLAKGLGDKQIFLLEWTFVI